MSELPKVTLQPQYRLPESIFNKKKKRRKPKTLDDVEPGIYEMEPIKVQGIEVFFFDKEGNKTRID